MSVTTETKIYFYKFDSETNIPELSGLMYNFMACNRLIQGPKSKLILSYQTNQTDLMIYQRSSYHRFIAHIDNRIILYCQTLSLGNHDLFCISDEKQINFHDIDSFKVIGKINILDEESDFSQS